MRPRMTEIEFSQDGRIRDRNLRAEGRVCEDIIELAVLASQLLESHHFCCFMCRDAIFETIERKNVPMSIVIHDHVHTSSLTQILIGINSVKALPSVSAQSAIDTAQFGGNWGLRISSYTLK